MQSSNSSGEGGGTTDSSAVNGGSTGGTASGAMDTQRRAVGVRKDVKVDVLRDAEASVLATFDFLAAEGTPGSDGTDDDEDDDVVMGAPSVDEMRPPCTQDPEGALVF